MYYNYIALGNPNVNLLNWKLTHQLLWLWGSLTPIWLFSTPFGVKSLRGTDGQIDRQTGKTHNVAY